ncbi:contact-dependent growth inhibition system immunity protein [Chamaesiphon sp. GL140_3_metabinner_50]|jgi:CDI immunity proteins|uniref:contact-dependent growth inhibition system immunity protein n=1 Tax=Chamaesiphon sp. GL140_3_metabinner_50 TaxID=2970812 RepID=UPI0025D04EA3|nr:contact-dependent growth inhibition system immunity protein [Chamaesiphon sp. GL140_3_metabinner_50]
MQFDRNKSLRQLEDKDCGEPTYYSSLVVECHRLHKIPLNEFTVENLRIAIGQNISLKYLIPIALEQLHINPLAEGKYYPGDLLIAVVNVNDEFWLHYADWRNEVVEIAKGATRLFVEPDDCDEYCIKQLQNFLEK